MKKNLFEITEKILGKTGYSISFENAEKIAEPGSVEINDLIICADKIRNHFKKNKVFLCSIINAKSGKCSQDCAFCAQSSFHQTQIETYPLLNPEIIIQDALKMDQAGACHYSIVTSGHSLTDDEIEQICTAVKAIKEKTDLTLCGSLGMLSEKSAKKLIKSGMTRYHHNLETAESHFDNICTTHTYEEDIETINLAIKHGFKVCTGGIFGLGESWKQRIELAFRLKELNIDTIPINFLNPVAGTKLEKRELVSPMDALKTIALIRIINPEKNITICGGREISLKDLQSRVFSAGSNGLMIGNYLTTSGRDISIDIEMVKDAGLIVETIKSVF